MPTINKLPAVDVVQSGDQLPVYSPNLGDARRMSVGTLAEYIEDNVIVPNNAANVTYDPAGTGAVARSVQAKLRDVVSVKDFGAVGNGVADDTVAIQNALNNGGGVYFPEGTYNISAGLTVSQLNTTLIGETKGTVGASTTIRYVGAATPNPMITVQNGRHGFYIDGFELDANLLADICLHVVANAGSATHHPALMNLMVRGYRTRGIVLGANDTVTLSNAQMQMVKMDRIYWQGGTLNAIGLLVNAQNIEFAVGNSWYFDIEPTTYGNHSNHIFVRAGGVNVQGLLSTRANSYAVFTYAQTVITGWRSEDRYLFDTADVQFDGPCVLTGVLARGGLAIAGDAQFRWRGIDSTLVVNGCIAEADFVIGPTNARYVSITGLTFGTPGGSVVYQGPQNQFGTVFDSATGQLLNRGSAPGFVARTAAGVLVSELTARTVFGIATLPAGATPSVTGGTIFYTNNVGATSITNLTNAEPGQFIILQGRDGGNTTVTDSAFINLAGGVNFTLGDNDCLTLICAFNGQLYELARSNN